ncbi:hypothetical protein XENOCAPTIV_010578 [Xenoophorus captivus]|uniref:Uncharacterized protein n=1 Tax=Xenoophorus captivus TaxID=1517983 RepID=A0ABV0RIB2_9TELE
MLQTEFCIPCNQLRDIIVILQNRVLLSTANALKVIFWVFFVFNSHLFFREFTCILCGCGKPPDKCVDYAAKFLNHGKQKDFKRTKAGLNGQILFKYQIYILP